MELASRPGWALRITGRADAKFRQNRILRDFPKTWNSLCWGWRIPVLSDTPKSENQVAAVHSPAGRALPLAS